MTRSIFDPTGNPEREGSRFTLPDAEQGSNLPDHIQHLEEDLADENVGFKVPPDVPSMVVSSENDDKLLVVRMSGKLRMQDYQQFVSMVERAVAKHGKISMLVEMVNFRGWDTGVFWESVKYDVKHFNDIHRLAVVGDSAWEKFMTTFYKPFTTATIKYFPMEQMAKARVWLTAE